MAFVVKGLKQQNKLQGKCYLLSSRIVDCTFCYALLRNDRHVIDQMWAADMHDCM